MECIVLIIYIPAMVKGSKPLIAIIMHYTTTPVHINMFTSRATTDSLFGPVTSFLNWLYSDNALPTAKYSRFCPLSPTLP
jgi:hypothetical protein